MTTLEELCEMLMQEEIDEPCEDLPRDSRGNPIVFGRVYTVVDHDALALYRAQKLIKAQNNRILVRCDLIWPPVSGRETRSCWPERMLPADPARLGRLWQELGLILHGIFAHPQEDHDG